MSRGDGEVRADEHGNCDGDREVKPDLRREREPEHARLAELVEPQRIGANPRRRIGKKQGRTNDKDYDRCAASWAKPERPRIRAVGTYPRPFSVPDVRPFAAAFEHGPRSPRGHSEPAARLARLGMTNPDSYASVTSWARLSSPTFASTRLTWVLAVAGLMNSRAASWSLVSPAATSDITSRS